MLARLQGESPIFYSSAVDCWALGCVLYECLTGEPPFWSDDDVEQVHLILRNRLSFPDDRFQGVSDEAKSLISGLLRPNAERRFRMIDCLRHPWFAGECRRSVAEFDDIANDDGVEGKTVISLDQLRSPVEQRLYPTLPDGTGLRRERVLKTRKSATYLQRKDRISQKLAQDVRELLNNENADGCCDPAQKKLTRSSGSDTMSFSKVRHSDASERQTDLSDVDHSKEVDRDSASESPGKHRRLSDGSLCSQVSSASLTSDKWKPLEEVATPDTWRQPFGRECAFEIAEDGKEIWKGPFARRGSVELKRGVDQALSRLSEAAERNTEDAVAQTPSED
jgi:serine/threonine protein kinase